MEPLVDVNIAVYNHAPYLKQTLDGVLNQKTTFPFRLLIGDDCSTDGSIEILKEYERKYPDKVKVIYQPKNLGFKSAERNGTIILKNSTAKYIALLDGDDYWTSPDKLQKQVSYLEAHDNIVISAHNSTILLSTGETMTFNRDEKYSKGPYEKEYTVEDYITRDFFQTSSIVFRRNALTLPDWFMKAFGGDYFIVLLTGMNGNIHYINDIFSVYRINSTSISNYSSRYEIFKNFDFHLHKYNEYSGFRYNKVMQGKIFAFRFNFYYYHPNYFNKIRFFFTHFRNILKISPSVISRTARFKMLVPTYFLRSKVNLFAKKSASK